MQATFRNTAGVRECRGRWVIPCNVGGGLSVSFCSTIGYGQIDPVRLESGEVSVT